MASNTVRRIDVLLFDGVNALDVAGPVQAFSEAGRDGARAYALRYVSEDGGPVRASCGLCLVPDAVLSAAGDADDLLVPGGNGVAAQLERSAVTDAIAVWNGARPDRRLIAVCSGSLLLAAAGVLDGRAATTHWSRAAFAAERFPRVRWRVDCIYIDGERVLTSAGVTAGIDLALAIVRRDRGAGAALAVGRELVVQMRRSGGQEQFSAALTAQHALEPALGRLVETIVADPARAWTLEAMAREGMTSARSLSRRFVASTGLSPMRFLERVRVDQARTALVDGAPLQTVAARFGFADVQRMRRAFVRQVGVTAADYARTFG